MCVCVCVCVCEVRDEAKETVDDIRISLSIIDSKPLAGTGRKLAATWRQEDERARNVACRQIVTLYFRSHRFSLVVSVGQNWNTKWGRL